MLYFISLVDYHCFRHVSSLGYKQLAGVRDCQTSLSLGSAWCLMISWILWWWLPIKPYLEIKCMNTRTNLFAWFANITSLMRNKWLSFKVTWNWELKVVWDTSDSLSKSKSGLLEVVIYSIKFQRRNKFTCDPCYLLNFHELILWWWLEHKFLLGSIRWLRSNSIVLQTPV